MQAGDLIHPVKVYQRITTQDPAGQPLEQYVFITGCYSKIEPYVDRDYEVAQQITSEVTHLIKMRYDGRIKPFQEVRYGRRVFEIVSIIDPNERKGWLRHKRA